MLLASLLLIVSLLILVAGAELLVGRASALARRMGVSAFFIGLTIVGFGTSSPELATSVYASATGHADTSVGNVVGSNIFNIAVVLGLSAMVFPIAIQRRQVLAEAPIMIGVGFIPLLALATGGIFNAWMGALMLAGLAVYIWRGYRAGRLDHAAEHDERGTNGVGFPMQAPRWLDSVLASVILLAIALAMLVLGAKLLVDSAVTIGRGLGLSELAIGLTIVAAGTSAPELVTSLVAAVRGQSEIAVGNVLGSNVFNILGVLGAASIVGEQRVDVQVFRLDLPVMIALSVICLPMMLTDTRLSRTEGGLLAAGYVTYVIVLLAVR